MTDNREHNAQEADFLLQHPLLTGAFDSVREDFVAQIEQGFNSAGDRDGVMIGLQVLRTIREALEKHVQDAVMAKEQLKKGDW